MNVSNQRQKNHHKRILAAVIAVLGVCVLIVCILAAENIFNMTPAVKVITIIGGCVAFGAAFIIAVILDRAAGQYECRESFSALSMRVITAAYRRKEINFVIIKQCIL